MPPVWLDLRGLRLPGNSKAAAGPGSARGLLWSGTGAALGRRAGAERHFKDHGGRGSRYVAGMAADGTGR